MLTPPQVHDVKDASPVLLQVIARAVAEDPQIAIDTEGVYFQNEAGTFESWSGQAEVVTYALSSQPGRAFFSRAHDDAGVTLRRALKARTLPTWAHGWKHDRWSVSTAGARPDSLVAMWLLGRRASKGYGLKALMADRGFLMEDFDGARFLPARPPPGECLGKRGP